ncbi:reverse transcriptase family protein [Methylomonas sp. DH-1]|uniref:reverse transcriptase family protein n=1 Tax=Methylomonas sp. (strain DH-1) TaxID=1727196 RepID=UPI0007C90706|nr:reverse transcriptase family protein [Methylomonas sp. DH-1]ANE56744.1 reverse transcriptase [Methylomonas sp. DH-1]
MKLKPHYPHNPIASIEALATTLGIHPKLLQDLANKADDSYTDFLITSKNRKGEVKDRTVCEPKFELKKLQKRINSRIFEKVEYPLYLQGGIRDEESPRDYVANAQIHAHANQIICIDIKQFYPSIKIPHVKNIFKYFFKFPEEVSEMLAKLVTYRGAVPQGGCTSSYIANLIFYDTEYLLVSELRKHSVKYSRLLDDITLSAEKDFTKEQEEFFIRKISAMFTKYGLSMHSGKKRIEHRSNSDVSFEVTGLWIGHKKPKARKEERRFVRQLVFMCEREYKVSPYTKEYHERWNEVSGKVAKLQRLEHQQAKNLRKRLGLILPLYDENMEKQLTHETKKLITLSLPQSKRPGNIKRVNSLINKLGILSRNNKALARSLRLQLSTVYADKPSNKEIWE